MRIPTHLPSTRSLLRTICSSFGQQQCRSIHLNYVVKTPEWGRSNPKLVNYTTASTLYKKPQDVRINLWVHSTTGRELIEQITLEDVLESHLKPGLFLVPVETPDSTQHQQQYLLKPIDMKIPHTLKSGKTSKRPRRGVKEFHFTLPPPVLYFTQCMWRSWHILQAGIPVEIQAHAFYGKPDNEDPKMIIEKINQNLHMRPDVILKAMPRASSIRVQPQTNRTKVCWVMGSPLIKRNGDVTKRGDDTDIFHERQQEEVRKRLGK